MKAIIVGGGHIGLFLALMLIKNGDEIKIIEYREEKYEILKEQLDEEIVFFGTASNPELLEKAGIRNADVVVAVCELDEINLVVTTLAKMEYEVPRVIGRVNEPKHAWLYTKDMGVDVVVNETDIITKLVIEEMDLNHMLTLLALNRGKYEIVQIKVMPKSEASNHFIKELSMPEESLILALTRKEEMLIPKGNTIVLAGDELLILMTGEKRKVIQNIFDPSVGNSIS